MEPCRRIVILKIGENPDDFKYYGNSNLGDILELRENLDNSAIKWKWDYKGSVPGGDHRFAISKANVIPAPSDPGSITVNSSGPEGRSRDHRMLCCRQKPVLCQCCRSRPADRRSKYYRPAAGGRSGR